jgi:hypothetical protein
MFAQQAYQPASDPWGGGGYSPLNSYQGSGYNAFDPSIYAPQPTPQMGSMFSQGGGGSWWDQYNAANAAAIAQPQQSFNDMWGNTPYAAGSGYAVPDMISLGYGSQSPSAMFNSRFSAAPGGGESPNYASFNMYGQKPDLSALYGGTGGDVAHGANMGWMSGYGQPAQPMAGDIGFSRQPSYPNLGYNSSFGSLFTPQSGATDYSALYGAMQFPNSGTPSQYYTGSEYGGGQYGATGMLPPGFATPYSFDNQGGALPAAPSRGGG